LCSETATCWKLGWNYAENDIAIVQLLQNQESAYNRRKRKEGIGILSQYELLIKELSDEDVPVFFNFVRVELKPAMFPEILARLGPRITKEYLVYLNYYLCY